MAGVSVAGRGWVRCRTHTRPPGQQLVLLGTCFRAVVHFVLCAPFGFAAASGRCCWAPVRVPSLWPPVCLTGVPRGPAWCAAARCATRCCAGVCCVVLMRSCCAPVHRCARLVRCFACAVTWATWLLFTGVPAWFVVLRLLCPWPLGSCSPVCALRPLLCFRGILGHLPPVHQCAGSMYCVACAVSLSSWLRFTGVLT